MLQPEQLVRVARIVETQTRGRAPLDLDWSDCQGALIEALWKARPRTEQEAYDVAERRASSWTRTARRRSDRHATEPHDVTDDDDPYAHVELTGMAALLARLTPLQERAVRLLLEGFTQTEAAAFLDVSQQTVSNVVAQARKRLGL